VPRPAWADDLRSGLVVDALEMALACRRPRPGLVHHSDHSSAVRLPRLRPPLPPGIELSVGSKRNAYDKALSEAFFKTLKAELVDRRSWPKKARGASRRLEFVERFSNPQRRHATLGYLSPAAYERVNEERRAA
jgi:transposase InsO family protein